MGQRLSRGYALHSEGSEGLTHVSIVPGCGAKLEGEEDAALFVGTAGDASLRVTGSAEGYGECVAELSFGRQGDCRLAV